MLRIIVSIKQVPDADDLRVDPITNTLVREGVPAVVNPPDLHAIEEGVRLKERYGGKVTVITMGPPQGESALRDALAMGADEAYLITDRSMAGADTWATSYTISRAVQKLGGADLYLFGRRAVDGETEQVGPQTAKWLGIPVVGYVSEVREVKERSVVVVKSTESLEEVLEVPLPAVLTILETANKPRQPDINSLIRARTAKIPKLTREDIGAEPNKVGLAGSPTKVIKVQPPPKTRNPEIKYVGKDQDVIDWLVQKIRESLTEDSGQSLKYERPKPKAKTEREVWVYVDHVDGEPNPASWEIMGEGRRIADLMSTSLSAVVIGDRVDKVVGEAFQYGADKVYHARTKGYNLYDNDVFTQALSRLVKKYSPEAVLFPGSRNPRELASTTAIAVDTGLIADCTNFDVDEKGILHSTRPDFGGKEMSTIICPNHRPVMVTVRPGVFRPLPRTERKGEVIREEVEDLFTRFKVLETRKVERRNVLAEADVVVGVGRGIRDPENIKLAEELAEKLGGVVGVTKPLADSGWYPKDRQVGQTGVTIRPKLYIALGISGAVQHLVGIAGARKVIAINLDPEAQIFQNSDYGVVGDLFQVVPELLRRL
ncbi:electron transfer flavoprotein, alpha subunit [Metallosphaera yellowstonensis MK1]|jgi:electron transfer flavoprotein alpha subunit|uniref:Electron transfer flavoprotein, alpha subunit n=2 Tax=Metallosphaera TaxID=41980 RepID=H2C4T1_9CREN|nr:FAD-binding protein [Metallosphaera yellowstonensis]EHP69873.1 electron transfer flavoprotein, alpha subunit [Metallosphaera yellowstonensis MK1]